MWLIGNLFRTETRLLPTGELAVRSRSSAKPEFRASAIFLFMFGRHERPHYRGFRLPLTDARTRLVLSVRFCVERVVREGLARLVPGLSLRTGSGSGSTGWGCVLRTASANIRSRSALVGAEGFVILPLFLLKSRTYLELTIPQQRRAAMKTTG